MKLGPIHIDGYTSAGFLSGIFALLNILLLPFTFRDIPTKTQNFIPEQPKMTKEEIPPMIITMILFFIVITVFSVFETLCTPITSHYFQWKTKLNGVLLLGAGALSVVTFIGLGIISKSKKLKIDDRILLLFGFVLMIGAMYLIVPYPFEKTLTLWQFLVSATLLSIGYPIASALVFSLFAKVINPVGQGTRMVHFTFFIFVLFLFCFYFYIFFYFYFFFYLKYFIFYFYFLLFFIEIFKGYLTAVGSLARMLGPIWGTLVFDLGKHPAEWVFLITAIVVSVGFFIILITFRILVPHADHEIMDPTLTNGIGNSVHSFTGAVGSFTTPNTEDPRSGIPNTEFLN